jgi:hypothetical protein
MDSDWVIKISVLSGLVFVGLGAWLYRLVVLGQCACACGSTCRCTCGCGADCDCTKRTHIGVLDDDPSGPLYRP